MSLLRTLAVGALAALLATGAAAADDEEEGPSFADILAMGKDKNASLKLDLLKAAIDDSPHEWHTKDVYALVDLELGSEIAEMAAAKAGIFWQGGTSLRQLAVDGRASAKPQTTKIGNSDLIILFEDLNDIKNNQDMAIKAVGDLPPRLGHEDDNLFQLRQRQHEEAIIKARSPWEGQVDVTSFEIELTGGFTPHDGKCTQAHINADLSMVQFQLFRTAMGGLRVEVPIAMTSKNVEKAQFVAINPYRFEAWSKPICVSSAAASSLAGQGSKLKMTIHRTFDGDNWTGIGDFHNAKTNAKL